MNDVRRGTREYLLRIRNERKARAEHIDAQPEQPSQPPEPAPRPGLMPDPLIARLSQQLVASGLIGASPAAEPAKRDPQRISRPSAAVKREAPGSSRISRQYDSALLGMSPLNDQDAKLKVDMSFARPARPPGAKREDLARFVGLEPLLPAPRNAASADAVAAVAPAASSRIAAPGPLPGIETVPTLGPGIVWRLSQAGIRSMADLAACDAATVRTKLGQIGRLVKVEDWISHARGVVSGQTPGATVAGKSGEPSPTASRALCFGRLGQAGMAAVTDGKGFGAANCPVAGAVVALDGWFVAVLEGAPSQVTKQLGHLIANSEISEMTLAAWEPIERRRLVAAGVQVAGAAESARMAGFDPRAHSASELMELVFGALSRN